jgi:apolipoprotein N-acyltransferase
MARMSDSSRGDRIRRIASRLGVVVSAFTVFTAGWIAMRSDDWRTIALVSALALVAGVIAAGLSRRTG